jgi:two-component system, NarL family, sensor histidine kinase DesK
MNFFRRIAGLPADQLMRSVGLAACALSGLLVTAWTWLNSSKMIAYNGTWLGQLAQWLSNMPAMFQPEQEHQLFHIFILLNFACTVIFAFAFWLRCRPSSGYSARINAVLLIIQIAIGLIGNLDLLYIVAVELAFFLPARSALTWLTAQIVLLAASSIPFIIGAGQIQIVCNIASIAPPSMMVEKSLGITWEIAWQTFAFCCGYIVAAELRTRIALAGTHAELLATQQFLKDALRTSERLRIARDLHDAIGHQLTALNLHLNLAERQQGSNGSASLQTARRLAQQLLNKVRAVVSIERKDYGINLRQALEIFCANIPAPRLTLAPGQDIHIDSPALAHAIFRGLQVAIACIESPSVATALHIALTEEDDAILLAIMLAPVDGRAAHNSLPAIRKQLAAQGWQLQTGPLPDASNTLHIRFPFSGNLS